MIMRLHPVMEMTSSERDVLVERCEAGASRPSPTQHLHMIPGILRTYLSPACMDENEAWWRIISE